MYKRVVFLFNRLGMPPLYSSGLARNIRSSIIVSKNGDVFTAAFPTTITMRNTAQ